MVKITFQTVSAQKPDKEIDGDKIIIPQAHVSLHTLFFYCFVLWYFSCLPVGYLISTSSIINLTLTCMLLACHSMGFAFILV